MLVDVSIIYDEAILYINSRAANFTEQRISSVGLSKKQGDEAEVIEFIGEALTISDLQKKALEIGYRDRVFRVIDPFSKSSFEFKVAALVVNFFCVKACFSLHRKTWMIRKLFKVDRIELLVTLPHYNLLPEAEIKGFEKELKKITKNMAIVNK